ncbi:acyl-CoA thioesterase [Corynebacterium mendelii]|uniref:Acyl-CoA thioesterase 2 n=1 Tax=Corynebacterium mendelii TaxID=2765362 RepID=A0A939IX73_9CORY|nr:acyl-CoA thioesterase II [Corynebacterium mendelii]MBN9643372.1 acyl-CoA thioesterase II [Corynebacterium mendelii]
MARIFTVLDVERIDRDIFRGPTVESGLTRTFGGQVAAQALVAAIRTVDSDHRVHSLHGYFVAPGSAADPVVFRVDRLKDGRSFSARAVTAIQHGRTIFTMQASFHAAGETGIEHADRMRKLPSPEEITTDTSHLRSTLKALLKEWSDWDIRVVHPDDYRPNPYTASQQCVWFRSKTPLPDDDTVHVCTLTYMSDMTLLQSALVPHPGAAVQEASLDHAIWFIRPFRADEWLLYDQVSPVAHAGRALTHGRIFNRSGQLVAVVTQEGLTRTLAPGTSPIPMAETPGT